MILNEELINRVKQELLNNQAVFITGSAGTGKSTLISDMKQDAFFSEAKYLGSTGISAYNIEGTTLHSLFKINPYAEDLSSQIFSSLGRLKKYASIFNDNTILIIDEISMVSNLLLETVSYILQRLKRNEKPFGGLRVVFVGDFLQLPPVFKAGECFPSSIKEYINLKNSLKAAKTALEKIENASEDDINIGTDDTDDPLNIKSNSKGLSKEELNSIISAANDKLSSMEKISVDSCYNCPVWKQLQPKIIYLTKLYRFEDSNEDQKNFINHLLQLRKGDYNINYWAIFHNNIISKKDSNIVLTSLRKEAESINSDRLKRLSGKTCFINYHIKSNSTQEDIKLLDDYKRLELKKGAKVLLTKNIDVSEGLVNGSRGTLIDVYYKKSSEDKDISYFNEKESKKEVLDVLTDSVSLLIDFEGYGQKRIDAQLFVIKKYNEKEEKKNTTVYYLPIMLAWAITIHKSQGLSLDHVTLTGANIFAPHQLYVALSRVRKAENLYIESLPLKIPTVEKQLLDLYS